MGERLWQQLQELTATYYQQLIFGVVVVLLFFVLWLLLRGIRLWYWRVNERADSLIKIEIRLSAIEKQLKEAGDAITTEKETGRNVAVGAADRDIAEANETVENNGGAPAEEMTSEDIVAASDVTGNKDYIYNEVIGEETTSDEVIGEETASDEAGDNDVTDEVADENAIEADEARIDGDGGGKIPAEDTVDEQADVAVEAADNIEAAKTGGEIEEAKETGSKSGTDAHTATASAQINIQITVPAAAQPIEIKGSSNMGGLYYSSGSELGDVTGKGYNADGGMQRGRGADGSLQQRRDSDGGLQFDSEEIGLGGGDTTQDLSQTPAYEEPIEMVPIEIEVVSDEDFEQGNATGLSEEISNKTSDELYAGLNSELESESSEEDVEGSSPDRETGEKVIWRYESRECGTDKLGRVHTRAEIEAKIKA